MTTRIARTRWVETGLERLARSGIDAVRIEQLASELGVTKGGFYGYFDGRPALLAEMLDEWERRFNDDILARAVSESEDAATQLRRVGELSSTTDFHRVDLAIREWARYDDAVAERLRRVDERRMEFLRSCFRGIVNDPVEVEARSTLMFALAVSRGLIVHSGDDAGSIRTAAALLLRPTVQGP